jgi:hypothetical protein
MPIQTPSLSNFQGLTDPNTIQLLAKALPKSNFGAPKTQPIEPKQNPHMKTENPRIPPVYFVSVELGLVGLIENVCMLACPAADAMLLNPDVQKKPLVNAL